MKKERYSKLSYSGKKKFSRLERKVAIIAFSIEEVYAIAELVSIRQKRGAAVIMGSLSPKTRNSQVGLYQSGDADYLIATDAIMGLNMDINEIYFSNLKKFDGRKPEDLI